MIFNRICSCNLILETYAILNYVKVYFNNLKTNNHRLVPVPCNVVYKVNDFLVKQIVHPYLIVVYNDCMQNMLNDKQNCAHAEPNQLIEFVLSMIYIYYNIF